MKIDQEDLDDFRPTPKEKEEEKELTICDLYPELTKEQQEEADYILGRYVAIIQEILEESEDSL